MFAGSRGTQVRSGTVDRIGSADPADPFPCQWPQGYGMTVVILPSDASSDDPMKTAVSLPDELFERAEQAAAELGVPRSNLYARALDEFLDRHERSSVTAQLDAVYGETATEEPLVGPAATFVDVEW